jgi:hypothetical protein
MSIPTPAKYSKFYAQWTKNQNMIVELKDQRQVLKQQSRKIKEELRQVKQQIHNAACKTAAFHAVIMFLQL